MVKKVTVCAKVSTQVARDIQKTGFSISDVIQAGLHMFLGLNGDQQVAQIYKQLERKRRERVLTRYHKIENEESLICNE